MLVTLNTNYKPQICQVISFKSSRTRSSRPGNFHQVDDYLWRGAQPTPVQLRQLKADGFRTIIDLSKTANYNEARMTKGLGLRYLGLQFSPNNEPTSGIVHRFLKEMARTRKKRQKAFIHCAQGQDRTGLFAAIYKVKYGLANTNQCIAEMLRLGHDQSRYPKLINYLRKFAGGIGR